MQFQEEILDERTLMVGRKVRPSGTMDMPGSEGAARRDVSRAGFRKKGPIQEPKVEKSGKDVPVWVRTHNSPGDYAAHTARKQHREGDKPQSKELKKQFGKIGAKKDSPVHDITVGSPKSKVKDPGQRARQFVSALKGVKDTMKSKKGVATNTPTAIDSAKSKGKKSRSGEEGAEQRGRIYKKLGMGERNPKTGVQMARLSDSFNRKTFGEFMYECYVILEGRSRMYGRTHNTRTDSRTGKTINRVREAFDILEVNRPESGNDIEKARWDKVRASIDARENPGNFVINSTGRDKDGNRRYASKTNAARRNQQKKRNELMKFIDSDLDSYHTGPGLSPSQRAKIKIAAIKNARGKGSGTMKPGNRRGEHHHLTSIEQSAKEFEGLTPEQRREKREKDAKMGKFHGNDPRNIAYVRGKNTPTTRKSVISHRGLGGYHSSENKPVGHGGSIADYGSEKQIQQHRIRRIRQALRKRRLERERQQDQRARMDVAGRANNLPERG